jgi:hypothetical protein
LLAAGDELLFASRSSFGLLASLLMDKPQAIRHDIDTQKPLVKRVQLKLKNLAKKLNIGGG